MTPYFNRKVIIAVLWIANTVIDLVQIALGSMSPEWIKGIENGNIAGFPITEGTIGTFAFVLVVPLLMAYLVLAIKNDKVNKWLNFIFALVIGLLSWIDFLHRNPAQIGIANWFVALATNIPLTIAVFYAWNLDKRSE